MYSLARPLLFCLDAERAHTLCMAALETAYRTGLNPLLAVKPKPLPTQALGISFPNPVGCAAGLDKNGEHIDALMALGFGFVEIGTVTPRPQEGNPKPRMFRLKDEMGIINRLGFNNHGVDALVKNVERSKREGILGINIGKNKATANEQAHEDYLTCFKLLAPLADYVAVNISSPNTVGLRALQDRAPLVTLLSTIAQENRSVAGGPVPLLLKIAPDLNPNQLADIVSVVGECGFAGIIATNTTVTRPAGTEACSPGRGGLSGAPLLERSLQVVRFLAKEADGRIPIVGCGGILSAKDAGRFMDEGACLVQVYSGLVFRGPELAREVSEGLAWRQRAWA